jgi:hypothetical protein
MIGEDKDSLSGIEGTSLVSSSTGLLEATWLIAVATEASSDSSEGPTSVTLISLPPLSTVEVGGGALSSAMAAEVKGCVYELAKPNVSNDIDQIQQLAPGLTSLSTCEAYVGVAK